MIVYLGLGSNIEPLQYIKKAKHAISTEFASARFSRTFQSEAVGFEGDDFHNLVAEIETDLSLEELIERIKQMEDKLGRVRGGEKFSSRAIDIDILLYGNLVCQAPIVLPREEILENAYVLWPLAELAPGLQVPGEMKTYQQMWQAFDQNKQSLHPLD